jgi:hypothetical protein
LRKVFRPKNCRRRRRKGSRRKGRTGEKLGVGEEGDHDKKEV